MNGPTTAAPGGVPRATPAGSAATRIQIGRLRLRVAGLDESAAPALARLVAEGLLPGHLVLPAGAHGTLRIEVPGDGSDPTHLLARRIVDRIGRAVSDDHRDGEWEP
jgi:hypothetical protein